MTPVTEFQDNMKEAQDQADGWKQRPPRAAGGTEAVRAHRGGLVRGVERVGFSLKFLVAFG